MIRKEDIKATGKVSFIFTNTKTGKKDIINVKNLFVTLGKNSIADRLRGADTGRITYCAIGTGTTAPALGNTQLVSESFRKLISVSSSSANVTTFETFLNESEGNGTISEAGLFGNLATNTANSGTLFCRTLVSRVKTSSDTLSIIWNVTIN